MISFFYIGEFSIVTVFEFSERILNLFDLLEMINLSILPFISFASVFSLSENEKTVIRQF